MFEESDGSWRAVLSRVTEPATYYVRSYRSQSRRYSIRVKTVPLIEEVNVVNLLYCGSRELCFVWNQFLQPGFGVDLVVSPEMSMPVEVSTCPHGVHAGQAANISRNDAIAGK